MLSREPYLGRLTAAIPGEYMVVSRIGFGRTGQLFHAKDRKTFKDVVLKLTPLQFAEHAPRYEPIFQTMCRHDNVVRIFKCYDYGRVVTMAMEYMRDGSLAELLAAKFVPVVDSISYCRQILAALGRVHANGIIHRDLTADNIMVGGEVAKLSDFGAAQHQKNGKMVSDLLYLPYIAPETLSGYGFSPASDIYGLGLTLLRAANNQYEFHTKLTKAQKRPLFGENIADVIGFAGHVPEKLRRIIRKAVSSDPMHRYLTAGAFQQDLRRLNALRRWRPLSESIWICENAGKEEVIRLGTGLYPSVVHLVEGRERSKTVHATHSAALNDMLAIVAGTTLQ